MVISKIQKLVIQCSIMFVFLMGFYPPWVYVDEHKVGHSMGYSFVWKAPIQHTSSITVPIQTATDLDFNVLILQLVLTCLTAGIACYMLRDIPDRSIYARK